MQAIIKCLVFLVLIFSAQLINAQDTIPAIKNKENIERLEKLKETIVNEEKQYLKEEIEKINERIKQGEITHEEADKLKQEVAKIHALNIENRIAIVDNKIALYKRNHYKLSDEEKQNLFGVNISNKSFNVKTEKKPLKYDIRTSNDFLFAIGINNTVIEGQNIDDSPYKFGSSRFVELGWNWKTRIFKTSPFWRVKYGFAFQWNGLNPKDNQYFEKNAAITELQTFFSDLKKSKFRVTNLVFPLHLELGPLKKFDREDILRHINNGKFKIGLGGYAGFNIDARQKLKYELEGENIKNKQKQNFNTTNLVYGLSSYIGFGDTALYVKYDLSPIFKNQLIDQNNISIGLRFDID